MRFGLRVLSVVLSAILPPGVAGAQVDAPPGSTMVMFGDFTGTDGAETQVYAKGLADLILTDAVAQEDRSDDCKLLYIDKRGRAAAEAEVALQQSPLFDPATGVTPGQMINVDINVSGTTSVENGQVSYSIEVRRAGDGTLVDTISGSASVDEFFDLSEKIARKLRDALCKGYTADGGTISGGAPVHITGAVSRLDVPFRLTGTFSGGSAVFSYTPTGPGGGKVAYALSGSGVTGSGQGDYTQVINPDGTVVITHTTSGCVDGGGCRTVTDQVTLTPKPR